jgi:hypothetical protein
LVTHKKKDVKAKMMIIDVLKDHLIPHISKKETAKEKFDALVGLYQSENINKKMILWNKLISIKMIRSYTVTNCLMKVMHIGDQLAAAGENIEDVELVNIAPNGFSPSWKTFVNGICAYENLPSFERLWDDSI